MTCIVGLQHSDGVLIGCDSAQSDGSFISAIDCPKIFAVGPLTFGYTTSFRFADLLQYRLHLKPRAKSIKDDKQYLVSIVVENIRKTLLNGGFIENPGSREKGGTALLAYNGKLYTLQDDFSIVRDTDGYAACGSGWHYALGSLATTQTLNFDPQRRVQLALESAIKHCATVQGPIDIRTAV